MMHKDFREWWTPDRWINPGSVQPYDSAGKIVDHQDGTHRRIGKSPSVQMEGARREETEYAEDHTMIVNSFTQSGRGEGQMKLITHSDRGLLAAYCRVSSC